jgi:WD40 repeat protein
VWDVATGAPVTPLMGHESWVDRFEFSPGGQWLLARGISEARVWDAQTGKPVTGWLKNPGADRIVAATFSPDGQRVATVAEGESVYLWDVATGAKTLQALEITAVTTVQFSGDGQRLVAGGSNGVSRLVWDLSGASARPLSLPGSNSVQHGFTLATFQRDRVFVWDIRTAKILLEAQLEARTGGAQFEIPTGSFSADGNRLLVKIGLGARLWDLSSGKELPKLAEARLPELSRDGSRILCTDKTVKIWEAENGRLLQEIKPAEGTEIIAAQLSPDGRMIAIDSKRGENAGFAQLWDAASGQAASQPLTHPGPPLVRFSPDGTRLLTLSTSDAGGVLRLWKLPGAEPVGAAAEIRLEPSEELPTPIFSPDGKRFVVFSHSGMRLFETASGKFIDSPAMRRADFVSARFSADGKLLATAGNGVQVWNAATGAPLIDPVKPPEHMDYQHVEFSADGRRLIAAGVGGPENTWGTTAIVDSATGRLIADSRTDEFSWHAAHFSPDDCLLVEESDPVRVWDVAPPGKGPAWLADLAEAVSGCVLTAAGTLEVLPDRGKRINAVRKQVATLPAEDRWAQVARWFLAEPGARTISPYSTVKVADYVKHREQGTFAKLKEVLAASPADPVAHANLGVKLLELSDSETYADVQADNETLLATKLAPKNAAVWQARAKVLTGLKRPTEAAAATKMAAEVSGH